ncbi:phosphatase PAP2 family protein [Bacteroidia bacterium]|nr:phosphatase PAP2 family protein [Bacteroidia bacterium]
MENFLEQILRWDRDFFLLLSGCHSSFFDGFMWLFSSMIVWIPMYACVLYVILRDKRKEFLFITLGLILTIVLSDQLSSGLIKPMVERLRPSHEPMLTGLVRLINGYAGGQFGFVSSHAANSFAFALCTALAFRYRPYTFVIFLWAALNSYSRIYLGVHYPLDVIGGAAVGIVSALFVYMVMSYIKKLYTGFNYKRLGGINTTVSGFEHRSIQWIIYFLLLTVGFICLFGYEISKFI